MPSTPRGHETVAPRRLLMAESSWLEGHAHGAKGNDAGIQRARRIATCLTRRGRTTSHALRRFRRDKDIWKIFSLALEFPGARLAAYLLTDKGWEGAPNVPL
ncbi:hypothetical protein FOCC_FOCC008962 [Frankliniella occidentalis]|nr:hypothetical protein FOCC_FOCC008962 [Frankliniella occidentalis]